MGGLGFRVGRGGGKGGRLLGWRGVRQGCLGVGCTGVRFGSVRRGCCCVQDGNWCGTVLLKGIVETVETPMLT